MELVLGPPGVLPLPLGRAGASGGGGRRAAMGCCLAAMRLPGCASPSTSMCPSKWTNGRQRSNGVEILRISDRNVEHSKHFPCLILQPRATSMRESEERFWSTSLIDGCVCLSIFAEAGEAGGRKATRFLIVFE